MFAGHVGAARAIARIEPRRRARGLAVLCVLPVAFTVVGMTVAPAPPSAQAMAGSSLAVLLLTGVVRVWLGRHGRAVRP
jgi:hypothetical protein